MPERSPGKYASAALNLSASKKYRLSIKTAKSVTYISDFVEAKVTPLIDSINYEVLENGVQVYVNSHDDSKKSIYYRWEYAETWEFFSAFYSFLVWNGNSLEDRDMQNNNISRCWTTNTSHPITLGSSAKLENDVIYRQRLTFLNSHSEKISYKYSVLARQYVLTKDAYEFWENLKKSTETLGSIFDPQPSQINGNIRNVANAAEPVIGYVSAGTYHEKRIFILKNNLPPWETTRSFSCLAPDTILSANAKVYFESGQNMPLVSVNGGARVTSGPKECVDCTLKGTNKRPAFWQ